MHAIVISCLLHVSSKSLEIKDIIKIEIGQPLSELDIRNYRDWTSSQPIS